MIGDFQNKGVVPRTIAAIFDALAKTPSWGIHVSVLEIYNERVRDLLAPNVKVAIVDVHEVRRDGRGMSCFRCPDATCRAAASPQEALAALNEGIRRRETARTDMNHHSSRSHLIFTLSVA